jgi:hypothetical protein
MFELLQDQSDRPIAKYVYAESYQVKIVAQKDAPSLYPYDDSENDEKEYVVEQTAKHTSSPRQSFCESYDK